MDKEGCLADLLGTMQRMGIDPIGSLDQAPNNYTEHRIYQPSTYTPKQEEKYTAETSEVPAEETLMVQAYAKKADYVETRGPEVAPNEKQLSSEIQDNEDQWDVTDGWIDLYATRLINELSQRNSLTVESRDISNKSKQTVAFLAMDGIAIIDKELSIVMRKFVDRGIFTFEIYGPGQRLIRLNSSPNPGAFTGMPMAERAFNDSKNK